MMALGPREAIGYVPNQASVLLRPESLAIDGMNFP
jgi:hypothetical protein